MTLYEFKSFDINKQADITWENGVLLGFREEDNHHMILYRIENFYVEIQYHTNQNEILQIKSFISEGPLNPYLDNIDISDLLERLS